jgi:hypothetical protein
MKDRKPSPPETQSGSLARIRSLFRRGPGQGVCPIPIRDLTPEEWARPVRNALVVPVIDTKKKGRG